MGHARRHCRSPVAFPHLPGDATCPTCGLALYVTDAELVGRYPDKDSMSGGIQGRQGGQTVRDS